MSLVGFQLHALLAATTTVLTFDQESVDHIPQDGQCVLEISVAEELITAGTAKSLVQPGENAVLTEDMLAGTHDGFAQNVVTDAADQIRIGRRKKVFHLVDGHVEGDSRRPL